MKILLLLAAGALGLALSACGSSSSQPATRIYTDPHYHFTLEYPSSWTAQKGQFTKNPVTGANKEYDVSFTAPNQAGQAQVSISGYSPLPTFVDGHRGHQPGGPPNAFFHFYHRTMSGLPAFRAELWIGANLTEIDTVANTKTLQYDLRTITGITSALPKRLQSQYDAMVASMHIPKS